MTNAENLGGVPRLEAVLRERHAELDAADVAPGSREHLALVSRILETTDELLRARGHQQAAAREQDARFIRKAAVAAFVFSGAAVAELAVGWESLRWLLLVVPLFLLASGAWLTARRGTRQRRLHRRGGVTLVAAAAAAAVLLIGVDWPGWTVLPVVVLTGAGGIWWLQGVWWPWPRWFRSTH